MLFDKHLEHLNTVQIRDTLCQDYLMYSLFQAGSLHPQKSVKLALGN
jgi:hypothetical protein